MLTDLKKKIERRNLLLWASWEKCLKWIMNYGLKQTEKVSGRIGVKC